MRQFGHLVEEDRAAVGLLKIALAGLGSAGEGTLLVAEKLGIDGSLGYGRTIDGDVLVVLARRIGVNDLRKNSLPTPLSPVTRTVRSVGATRKATSSARSRSSEVPIMPKRCLTLVISVMVQVVKSIRKVVATLRRAGGAGPAQQSRGRPSRRPMSAPRRMPRRPQPVHRPDRYSPSTPSRPPVRAPRANSRRG